MPPNRAAWTAIAIAATGCAQTISPPKDLDESVAAVSPQPGGQAGHDPVAGLPFANGRTFGTLDEYLAFRRELGAVDKPFYREISPGLYELDTGRALSRKPSERYTREQLLAMFGFAS